MVPVLDVPLIDLALARSAGVEWDRTVVNVSGPSPGLREHLRNLPGVEIFDEGPEPLGQAATIRSLLPGLPGTVVTYNCDLVSDLDLGRLLEFHAYGGLPCTLAVTATRQGADIEAAGGRLRLVDRRLEDPPGFLFLGAACFEPELLREIPDTRPLGLAAAVLRPAIEQSRAALYEHPGYGFDCGSLGRYLSVSRSALGGRPAVHPPGEISPEGWYRGPGARVEGQLETGAVVLAGGRVAAGATIGHCIVWPGSVVRPGTYRGGIWFEDRWLPAG